MILRGWSVSWDCLIPLPPTEHQRGLGQDSPEQQHLHHKMPFLTAFIGKLKIGVVGTLMLLSSAGQLHVCVIHEKDKYSKPVLVNIFVDALHCK